MIEENRRLRHKIAALDIPPPPAFEAESPADSVRLRCEFFPIICPIFCPMFCHMFCFLSHYIMFYHIVFCHMFCHMFCLMFCPMFRHICHMWTAISSVIPYPKIWLPACQERRKFLIKWKKRKFKDLSNF